MSASRRSMRALAAQLDSALVLSSLPKRAGVARRLPASSSATSSARSFASTSRSALASEAPKPSSSSSKPEAAAAKDAVPAPPSWKPTSRRVGLIAVKRGMMTYFHPTTGHRIPATVLQISSNQISSQTVTPTYTALQVAAVESNSSRAVSKAVKGHLEKAGIEKAKKVLKEFRVTPDALLPLGTELSAAHFVPGQHIDVRGITRGKGFQGVMKRHGFRGLRASHGVSISHRSHGSTGQHQDPGRVFPGKKMAGRMGGNKHRTVHNLQVMRVDLSRDLLVVSGAVPGPEGGIVTLTDARRTLIWKAETALRKGRTRDGTLATGNESNADYLEGDIKDLPFPAGTREMAKGLPDVVEMGEIKA